MKIKFTIKSNSTSGKAFKRYMQEKAAFREAVRNGNVVSYVKQRGIKFDTPEHTNQ